MVTGNCLPPHPYVPLYSGCLCCYSDGNEPRNNDTHCHVSCWGAVTILTVQKPPHHFWAVISNSSPEIQQLWRLQCLLTCCLDLCSDYVLSSCMIRCCPSMTEEKFVKIFDAKMRLWSDGRYCPKMYCVSVWSFGKSYHIIPLYLAYG